MKEATLIYPHQLFKKHPGLSTDRPVFLIEEPLLFSECPAHRQRLLLHRASLTHYGAQLTRAGYNVTHLTIDTLKDTEAALLKIIAEGFTTLHIVDTTDYWLEMRIQNMCKERLLSRVWYESPLFLLSREEAIARYKKSGKHMARFYASLRKDYNVLMESDGSPKGGKFSFDEDNRKKLPKNIVLPEEIVLRQAHLDTAWLSTLQTEHHGNTNMWLPYTHTEAEVYLENFLNERLHNFGNYEDAMSTQYTRLFHSTLSPLLNIGLLTPAEVLKKTLEHAHTHAIAHNNTEGFVRQVLGWREFIRAAYECDGVAMRTKNFWGHTKKLPASFWDATTGIPPVDTVIRRALTFGYSHHIERLMVMGNFMLLSRIHPDEVYRWFMALYVDAYDWVMVPNVYGMSQFADGGIFATKPYISGSSYLRKMSDYPKGDWEELWTALYWQFISDHKTVFLKNHRLSMMPKLLEKMSPEKKSEHTAKAKNFLDMLTQK